VVVGTMVTELIPVLILNQVCAGNSDACGGIDVGTR
jgi:hypothetical protein